MIIIGVVMVGYGIYTLAFPEAFVNPATSNLKMAQGNGQSFAMMAFGLLCLISGIAFRRKK